MTEFNLQDLKLADPDQVNPAAIDAVLEDARRAHESKTTPVRFTARVAKALGGGGIKGVGGNEQLGLDHLGLKPDEAAYVGDVAARIGEPSVDTLPRIGWSEQDLSDPHGTGGRTELARRSAAQREAGQKYGDGRVSETMRNAWEAANVDHATRFANGELVDPDGPVPQDMDAYLPPDMRADFAQAQGSGSKKQ